MLIEFLFLAQSCAASVAPNTMGALVSAESDFNTYAIGVVRGQLSRQPRNLPEALSTVRRLEERGINYSVGLAQINQSNFSRYGLNESNMFEPCANLTVGAQILSTCFETSPMNNNADSLRSALACYYSGKHRAKKYSKYVSRVIRRSNLNLKQIKVAVNTRNPKNKNVIRIIMDRDLSSKKNIKRRVPIPMVSYSADITDNQTIMVKIGNKRPLSK